MLTIWERTQGNKHKRMSSPNKHKSRSNEQLNEKKKRSEESTNKIQSVIEKEGQKQKNETQRETVTHHPLCDDSENRDKEKFSLKQIAHNRTCACHECIKSEVSKLTE